MESNGLSGQLVSIIALTESNGGKEVETSLLSDPAVENLDVFSGHPLGLLTIDKAAVIDQLSLQGAPETFHRCIIPAITFAAH